MEPETYSRGDWVTLSEPIRGVRAVVVEVRVKLMTVAYVDGYETVATRNVPIRSVEHGHSARGHGWEAVGSAFEDLKVAHATEFMEFAVGRGLLEPVNAAALVDAYVAESSERNGTVANARIERERKILEEWLRIHHQ